MRLAAMTVVTTFDNDEECMRALRKLILEMPFPPRNVNATRVEAFSIVFAPTESL
jgi:hypothetical protein